MHRTFFDNRLAPPPGSRVGLFVASLTFLLLQSPLSLAVAAEDSPPLLIADFARPGHGWHANRSLDSLRQGADGLSMRSVGEDPYLVGPPVDILVPPGTTKLLLELDGSAAGDIRCYSALEGEADAEERAVQLVADGRGKFRGVIPALGARMRFRLDPPDGDRPIVFRRLEARPLAPLFRSAPRRQPVPVVLPEDALTITQGAVRVAHDPRRWNALAIWVDGRRMADTDPSEEFFFRGDLRAMAIDPNTGSIEAQTLGDGVEIVATVREAVDPSLAATWRFSRRITAATRGVRIETSLSVDRPREAVHLPWLTLFAGLGSFGTHKSQALLPGVEYLDDEPSSNEKEIRGPAANRLLVDPAKVCFPTMVLAASQRWLAVDWEPGAVPASPLFDSPDRHFNSGGHLLALLSPAAAAFEAVPSRFEGEAAVYRGLILEPGKPLSLAVTLRGGTGDSVLDAVSERVLVDGLPPIPEIDLGHSGDSGLDAACRLLAHGWLDSAARDGTRWRHAVWQGRFAPQPAADVPPFLLWLAAHVSDPPLADRLRNTAAETLAALPPGAAGGIGHLSRPSLPLLLRPSPTADGSIGDALVSAAASATEIAATLTADAGRDRYVAGKTDYAATLGADHCNGHTALRAEAMLEAAALTGDEEAIRAAIGALDLLTKAYPAGAVPRGAQPWEMPLHTPDILASARLVRCHVLGYLLDGNPTRIEEARAWAWSGVPFVYLRDPLPGPVGRYATIGVLGATDWVAPVWVGQPVQWCGLVYAGALHDLAAVSGNSSAPWRTLASGITRCGLFMTFPVDDPDKRGGLLPDYWLFGSARGDGPAINPGTVQATLAEAFGATPLVTATRLPGRTGRSGGHVLHVAGDVRRAACSDTSATVGIVTWPESPCRLLLTRVAVPPRSVTWNGQPVAARLLATGCLSVTITPPETPRREGTLVIEW